MNVKVKTKSKLGRGARRLGQPLAEKHAEKHLKNRLFIVLASALLFAFTTGLFEPFGSARAGIRSLVSGERGQDGQMLIQSDEFGAFGNCGPGQALFHPDFSSRRYPWQCFGGLMLTHGNDFQWLIDDILWLSNPVSALSDGNVVSDTVNDARTIRTSQFLVDLVDLQVDLVQETPTLGYNFVQTYTFTNTSKERLSLKAVLFNDQDLEFEQNPIQNRVGFVPGDVPRMYFIEESDVAGPGDPGIDDRDRRISVATKMGEGITYDGFLGVTSGSGASDLHLYVRNSPGILDQDLNTIQQISQRGNLGGANLDRDGDGLVDSNDDVAAAMQFSMDLPVGGSASLAFDYIGGNLSNAIMNLADDADALQAGDADQDFDFDQLDLVKVQVADKYLSGSAATWGEGDWDGAPSGRQGNPPVGDGQFNQLDIIAALGAGNYLKGPYAAINVGGVAGDLQASLVYDANSGELNVDSPASKDLNSINITSAGNRFAGDKPAVLDGAFDNVGDDNIFKATSGGSFGSISFGNVLPAGLSEADVTADLTAVGSTAGGGDVSDVDLAYIPEPSTFVMVALAFVSMLIPMRRSR